MFSMDMTGEDTAQTGGTFLVERYPDPGAVWTRAWDPHTEWGAGQVRADALKGDLINDLHLAICERVGSKVLAVTKRAWDVRSNPYEGGSDHTQFQGAGIPSVLDWHFTDRYYHTNQDTAEKTSPDEMRNVGTAVAASAWFMASATAADGDAVRELIAKSRARPNLFSYASSGLGAPARTAMPITELAIFLCRAASTTPSAMNWLSRSSATITTSATSPRFRRLAIEVSPVPTDVVTVTTCLPVSFSTSGISSRWAAVKAPEVMMRSWLGMVFAFVE